MYHIYESYKHGLSLPVSRGLSEVVPNRKLAVKCFFAIN